MSKTSFIRVNYFQALRATLDNRRADCEGVLSEMRSASRVTRTGRVCCVIDFWKVQRCATRTLTTRRPLLIIWREARLRADPQSANTSGTCSAVMHMHTQVARWSTRLCAACG